MQLTVANGLSSITDTRLNHRFSITVIKSDIPTCNQGGAATGDGHGWRARRGDTHRGGSGRAGEHRAARRGPRHRRELPHHELLRRRLGRLRVETAAEAELFL